MNLTLDLMTLQDLLREHGILTIQEFGQKVRLSKQHAWRLWHGKDRLGLRMAHRIAKATGIPLADLIAVEEASRPDDDPDTR